MQSRKAKAVFLDRDGVINEIVFHQEMGIIETPFTPQQFTLKSGVVSAIREMNKLGLKVIVVSNQPGVAMRHFSVNTLNAITAKMLRKLRKGKAKLDGIYYCLHHPTKGVSKLRRRCSCRKPKAGMLRQAARDHGVSLRKSYMIGDSILDVQAGRKAGCTTFLLAHLKCDLCHLMNRRGIKPDYLVVDLREAVKRIKQLEKQR